MTLIHVRCFTCGKVTGNMWESYQNMLTEGIESPEALDRLGLKRYCCRRILLTHADLIDKLLKYSREGEAEKQCEEPTQID